jgi:DNA-binding response OmpR family regulator
MKILIAEDDESIQSILQFALTRIGKHEVICTSNGEECLKALENNSPDLILLDVMMPKLDGIETIKKIKTNQAHKNTTVLFLSAKTQKADELNALALGAKGYIYKPFDPVTISSTIEEYLKNSTETPVMELKNVS